MKSNLNLHSKGIAANVLSEYVNLQNMHARYWKYLDLEQAEVPSVA